MLGFVGIVTLFGLTFWPTFIWMGERFSAHDSFYSHGWLVPLASTWLIWQRRRLVQAIARRPSARGLSLLLPGLFLHALAAPWDVHVVSGVGMLMTIWGLVWTLFGFSTLWSLRLPMLFLAFMVPLPGIVLIAISFKMKLFAAMLATAVLSLLGVPAVQAGSMIQVPGVSVMVDDTCSGLRSLISLVALATLWTSLMPPAAGRWQKAGMVAASLPIALVANMVRIVTLVLVSAVYGPEMADGFIHYGSGMVVFGVALAILAWLSRRLGRPMPAAGGAL